MEYALDFIVWCSNWMAWCKRDVSDSFRWSFFSFKSAWIFACTFQLSRKTFFCIVFLAEMLLFCFVVFVVHPSIFCLCFSQKESANQAKKIQGNVVLLNWKAHAKIFEGKKLSPEKVTYIPDLAPSHSIVNIIHSEIFPHFWLVKTTCIITSCYWPNLERTLSHWTTNVKSFVIPCTHFNFYLNLDMHINTFVMLTHFHKYIKVMVHRADIGESMDTDRLITINPLLRGRGVLTLYELGGLLKHSAGKRYQFSIKN